MSYVRGHGWNLHDYLPDAEHLLELEPEEIGLAILRTLNARPEREHHGGNFANEFAPMTGSAYPERAAEVQRAGFWRAGPGSQAKR
jgi:hypothetical protein